jgi:heat shock protein HslJ
MARSAPLDAYLWELIELNGETLPDGALPSGAHLIFLEAEARIAGTTGCNRLMGGYERSAQAVFS